jgi:hypothetical protein
MEEFDDIPDALKRDLKAAVPRLEIPAARDAAIKAAARPQLRRRLLVWRSAAFIGAAAAIIAITLILLVDWSGKKDVTPIATAVVNDMNADGNVDIRDGLILAQKTKGGKSIPAPWNNAIMLTEADVKSLANQIVTLPPTGNAVSANRNAPLATLAPELTGGSGGVIR